MKTRNIRYIFLTCLLLAGMLLSLPSLAESAASSAPSILLDGQPVKKTVLNLSAGNQLKFTSDQPVAWASSKSYRAAIDQTGLMTAKSASTVVITATNAAGQKASCEVRIARLVTSLSITGPDGLAAGKSGTLRAVCLPSNAASKKVVWTSSDPSVVSVSSSGKITAKKVNGVRSAVITATAADGSGASASHSVTVTPIAASVQILKAGQPVSGTVMVDIANPTLDLDALVAPSNASQSVTWKTSSSSRAVVDANGVVTASRTGTVTITATAADGSGKKASVKLSIVSPVQSITVSGDTSLAGGKKGDLKASVYPKNATNKNVVWASSDPSVVTVNKYGDLKAANVSSRRQATVTATAKDGSGVTGSVVVTVTPKVSNVDILRNSQPVSALGIDLGTVRTVQLGALVEPADAMQDVKWTTSSKKRATVDQNGVVTALSKGSVTITATAKDGSGKKASVKLEIGVMARQISITGGNKVASGKKLELGYRIAPSNVSNKNVVWSSSNPSVAAVNKYGVVTAGPVDAPTEVTITATAKDGSGTAGQQIIQVLPVARSISIRRTDANMATALILNQGGSRAHLGASVYPAAANQAVKWKSSNTSVVTVDSNGVVTAHKKGTATITATAADGSGAKQTLWVGVGDLSALPYYFEVDRANQVVRVYARGADNTYTTLIKRMICSTHSRGTEPQNRLYTMHGGRMVWMDRQAIYATRVHGAYLFHSVTYTAAKMNALDPKEYNKLGTPASAGCFRLLAGDAKWIYDNVPKGCFVNLIKGVRDVNEYGSVSKPPLGKSGWDPTNPHPDNPDFDPTYTSNVK